MAPSSDLDHGILAPKGVRDRRVGHRIIRPARTIHEVAEAICFPRWQRERHSKATVLQALHVMDAGIPSIEFATYRDTLHVPLRLHGKSHAADPTRFGIGFLHYRLPLCT